MELLLEGGNQLTAWEETAKGKKKKQKNQDSKDKSNENGEETAKSSKPFDNNTIEQQIGRGNLVHRRVGNDQRGRNRGTYKFVRDRET